MHGMQMLITFSPVHAIYTQRELFLGEQNVAVHNHVFVCTYVAM